MQKKTSIYCRIKLIQVTEALTAEFFNKRNGDQLQNISTSERDISSRIHLQMKRRLADHLYKNKGHQHSSNMQALALQKYLWVNANLICANLPGNHACFASAQFSILFNAFFFGFVSFYRTPFILSFARSYLMTFCSVICLSFHFYLMTF